ncbi:MAG: malate dehydrogenase [Methanoculleaceae archaeon]
MTRLTVLGLGRVGGEVAYLSALLGLADELVVHDISDSLLRAQVMDLRHAATTTEISTDINKIPSSDIALVTAGAARNPSIRNRADLLDTNFPVMRACADLLDGFSGVAITVTNPADVNTYILHRLLGCERSRVIGFGGQLDSARFNLLLAEYGIGGEGIVLGEHGDHQVPIFHRLKEEVSIQERNRILSQLRTSSMEVIRGKGGTVFGPAAHIIRLIRYISTDERCMVPCSCTLDGEYGITGCAMGVPVRIGRNGVLSIEEWEFDEWERSRLDEAADYLTGLCRRIDV